MSNDSLPGIAADGKYKRDYLTVYDLMPHTNDLQTGDLLQYALVSTRVTVIIMNQL